MKYLIALMIALAISFSSTTFAAEPEVEFTQHDCVQMGEVAYLIATARDQGVPADTVLSSIIGSNGEATEVELTAFSDFVNGIYSEEMTAEAVGVAVIQSCIGEVMNG